MRKLFAALLCVVLCVIFLAASVAEGSDNYPQAYEAMLKDFERGIYDYAYRKGIKLNKIR